MTRRLRITVSVFFAVLTVLLCVLWVRSYWRIDYIRYTNSSVTTIGYRQGRLCFARRKLLQHAGRYHGWEAESLPMTIPRNPYSQFQWSVGPQFANARIPFWLPILLCCLPITAQWIPRPSRRFSLRTLFIAMTLLAVVLGLAVWLSA